MKPHGKIKPLLALLLFAMALVLLNSLNQHQQLQEFEQDSLLGPNFSEGVRSSDWRFAEAFKARQSDIQLSGEGTIRQLLADDLKGSRHQRLLVELESGQTLLLVHNIDLAARLEDLRIGEPIEFSGEYEWNAQGGVLHWTHQDPRGRHVGGWIKYRGRVYR